MPPTNSNDTAWSITIHLLTGSNKTDDGIKMFIASTKEEVVAQAKLFLSKKKVAYLLQYNETGEIQFNPVLCGAIVTPFGLVWSIPK